MEKFSLAHIDIQSNVGAGEALLQYSAFPEQVIQRGILPADRGPCIRRLTFWRECDVLELLEQLYNEKGCLMIRELLTQTL
jgi:hypothetical protein